MKILIADDEPLARALMRALIEELPDVEILGEAADGSEAINATRAFKPELVFLDIDMPGQNGIHAAAEIGGNGAEVIFVTAHEEHAVDAFDMGAVDYLLKPVRRPRLIKAMERARRRLDARHSHPAANCPPGSVAPPETGGHFWIPMRNGTVRVAVCDILRVEAAGDLVYLHTLERAYIHRTTMTDLEQRLQGSGLIRIHRSAFIRPDRVIETRRRGKVTELVLDDGAHVPVGPRYRAAAMAHIRGVEEARLPSAD